MRSIALIDVDSKIPNLALMKISSYYRKKGYNIDFIKLDYDYYPSKKKQTMIDCKVYEAVFISIIFPINKGMVKIINCDRVTYGGTGYDLRIRLPENIDECLPDYSLYPLNDCSYGFITRGCIRNCPFCFVPRKEGMLKEYNKLNQIINPKFKRVIFMDNNFLAWSKADETLKYLRNCHISFQFNQGLDIRLITEKRAQLLSECKYFGEILFAFDDIRLEKIIKEKYDILKKYFIKDWKFKFYIYCNANMPLKNIIYRVLWCKKHKVLPYLMRDINCWNSKHEHFYTDLGAWCNQPAFFKSITFDKFMIKRTKNVVRQKYSINLYLKNCNFSEA